MPGLAIPPHSPSRTRFAIVVLCFVAAGSFATAFLHQMIIEYLAARPHEIPQALDAIPDARLISMAAPIEQPKPAMQVAQPAAAEPPPAPEVLPVAPPLEPVVAAPAAPEPALAPAPAEEASAPPPAPPPADTPPT